MKKIFLLGTGLLGTAIGERLISLGFTVHAWNRTSTKLNNLCSKGAIAINSLEDLSFNNDIVITVLKDATVASSVISKLGNLNSSCVIQISTVSPTQSICLESQVSKKGGLFLEAPVLGSKPEALSGSLIFIVGGATATFEKYLPFLQTLSKSPYFLGSIGKASAAKLALNQLIATLTYSFSLSLRFIQGFDISEDQFMNILRESSLYAPTFDKKLERMLNTIYTNPNFNISMLSKDLGLFIDESSIASVNPNVLLALQETIQNICGDPDLEELDYSVLHENTKTIPGEISI